MSSLGLTKESVTLSAADSAVPKVPRRGIGNIRPTVTKLLVGMSASVVIVDYASSLVFLVYFLKFGGALPR